MKDSGYGVVYLLRKTSMTLAEIRSLSPPQFREIIEEVYFQEAVAEHKTAYYLANILAAITNTVPRKGNRTYKAADFLAGKEPRRVGDKGASVNVREELEALAKKFNIRLPAKEIKDL